MRNSEAVRVETFDIRETGPYIGQRIARTSANVVEAVLSKEYIFADQITIRVIAIPARLDRATGRTYLSAHHGRTLTQMVRRYTDILRKSRASQTANFPAVALRVRLNASNSLAA